MDVRHLRCFLAVAEELNITRAAARLHIEQSPLSRTIKELEIDLDVVLFERSTRGVRLTPAGKKLLEDAPRILMALEQARTNVKSAASGFQGVIRVALSDCIPYDRLQTLLAGCLISEPEVEIRIHEVSFSMQVKGLLSDLYDVGFARSGNAPGICAQAAWTDKLVAALPAGHPLLKHRQIPLAEAVRYPLILCHPEACEGHYQQIDRLLKSVTTDEAPLRVAEHARSQNAMKTLVSAGYGLGIACLPAFAACQHNEIIIRSLSGAVPAQTTYILRPDSEPSPQLVRFIERATTEYTEESLA